MSFLRICFGGTVVEGYGMTETSCTMCLTHPDDLTTGTVGAPIPSCEMKLVDIPEMGYTSTDKPYPRCVLRGIARTSHTPGVWGGA